MTKTTETISSKEVGSLAEALKAEAEAASPLDAGGRAPAKVDPIFEVDKIARMTHEANRLYCALTGDMSQASWDEAPAWQKESARNGVKNLIANPDMKPKHSHAAWMRDKELDGWKYGAVKDPEKKEHPCMVPYGALPREQRIKDALFTGLVKALILTE